jgi:hypothetical protein
LQFEDMSFEVYPRLKKGDDSFDLDESCNDIARNSWIHW